MIQQMKIRIGDHHYYDCGVEQYCKYWSQNDWRLCGFKFDDQSVIDDINWVYDKHNRFVYRRLKR